MLGTANINLLVAKTVTGRGKMHGYILNRMMASYRTHTHTIIYYGQFGDGN